MSVCAPLAVSCCCTFYVNQSSNSDISSAQLKANRTLTDKPPSQTPQTPWNCWWMMMDEIRLYKKKQFNPMLHCFLFSTFIPSSITNNHTFLHCYKSIIYSSQKPTLCLCNACTALWLYWFGFIQHFITDSSLIFILCVSVIVCVWIFSVCPVTVLRITQ